LNNVVNRRLVMNWAPFLLSIWSNSKIIRMITCLTSLQSFCICAMFLARDVRGIRPLLFGSYTDQSGSTVWGAASETAALTQMGIHTFYNVRPGEMIRIDEDGIHPLRENNQLPRADASLAACAFEGIYLADEKSALHGPTVTRELVNVPSVLEFRQRCGQILAREAPLSRDDVDFIIGIPGTGITGGKAYAEALGLPYIQAIMDHDPHGKRTFMTANLEEILQNVANNFDFDIAALKGMRVGLIDDSIVRGNIMTGLRRLLQEVCGVRSTHIRALCPMIDKGCHLGINTRNQEQLVAFRERNDVERIREVFGASSLAYISPDGLKEAFGNQGEGHCYGCMIGHHPPINRLGVPLLEGAVYERTAA